ncbi:MAG TPA: HAD family hydrolase [Helicobacteraceae bacterium]|nr:HAD family hydrolase [Helicobacteraceae bacterium]
MKVVLFDMDGTLIDSQHDITASINYVRKEHYALEALESTFVVEAINRYQRNLPKLFYGTQDYEPSARELFEAHYYDQCIQSPRLYDGIAELLEQLQQSDVALSVATNAPSMFAVRMLEHLNIAHYFDHIVGADMVVKPKPDGAMLNYALERLAFDAQCDHAWMVGDNSKDMEAAHNVNITSIFATWGFSSHGEGDHVIAQPQQLLDIVKIP